MRDLATETYELINRLVREAGVEQMPNPYEDICYLNKHGHWQDEAPLWVKLICEHFQYQSLHSVVAELFALRYEIERLRRNSVPVLDLDAFYARKAEFPKE